MDDKKDILLQGVDRVVDVCVERKGVKLESTTENSRSKDPLPCVNPKASELITCAQCAKEKFKTESGKCARCWLSFCSKRCQSKYHKGERLEQCQSIKFGWFNLTPNDPSDDFKGRVKYNWYSTPSGEPVPVTIWNWDRTAACGKQVGAISVGQICECLCAGTADALEDAVIRALKS